MSKKTRAESYIGKIILSDGHGFRLEEIIFPEGKLKFRASCLTSKGWATYGMGLSLPRHGFEVIEFEDAKCLELMILDHRRSLAMNSFINHVENGKKDQVGYQTRLNYLKATVDKFRQDFNELEDLTE